MYGNVSLSVSVGFRQGFGHGWPKLYGLTSLLTRHNGVQQVYSRVQYCTALYGRYGVYGRVCTAGLYGGTTVYGGSTAVRRDNGVRRCTAGLYGR